MRATAPLISVGLATALAVSCSGRNPYAPRLGHDVTEAQAPPEDTGTVRLELIFPSNAEIDSAGYTVTGPAAFRRTGTLALDKSSTVSGTVGDIPAGSGYAVSLAAATPSGTLTCAGASSPFIVLKGATTMVVIQLQCSAGALDSGELLVDAAIHLCPRLQSVSVVPASVVVGSMVALSASAVGPAGGPPPQYAWRASPGLLSQPSSPSTMFTCTSVGTAQVTLTITAGDPTPGCPAVVSLPITCAPCGSDGTQCNDFNGCTQGNTCQGGACTGSTAAPAGTACGLGVCDGNGQCSQCLSASNCPGSDTACSTRTCTAGACGVNNAPAGTVTPTQTAGDCHTNECDGMGGVVSVVDDTNKPGTGNPCVSGTCNSGVPATTPIASGTQCATGPTKICDGNGNCVGCLSASDCPASTTTCATPTCSANTCGANDAPEGASCTDGGGTICNGAGSCIPFTFQVARIGDGSTAPSANAMPVFIEQRNVTDGTLVSTVNMPAAIDAGPNNPFATTGLDISEGALSRSVDGHYLTMAGYAAAPGTGSPTSSVTLPRVVARIDASGNVDTSTLLTGSISGSVLFGGGSARSAATVDGSGFWVGGTGSLVGSTYTGGVWYVPFGTTTGSQVNGAATRTVGIFASQLYADGDETNSPEVFAIGSGLPVSGLPSATELPGFPPTTTAGLWAFVLLDVNPAVTGLDTIYAASDRVVAFGDAGTTYPMGIQKWTFDGSTWSYSMTLDSGVGFRGVTGLVTGPSTATIIGSTVESPGNQVLVFVDNGTTVVNGTQVASPTNEIFRGVALTPHN
jgi:hypothetical protein